MYTCLTSHLTTLGNFVTTRYLGKIASIIEEKDTSNVVITGDVNAAVSTPFESKLIALCANISLVISDYAIFGRASNTYMYVSDAHNSTSWLDHFICSHSVNSMITDLYILEKSSPYRTSDLYCSNCRKMC